MEIFAYRMYHPGQFPPFFWRFLTFSHRSGLGQAGRNRQQRNVQTRGSRAYGSTEGHACLRLGTLAGAAHND